MGGASHLIDGGEYETAIDAAAHPGAPDRQVLFFFFFGVV
jgi:hypothetical protein